MSRVYNFSAGPAVLPEEVLKEAADEMMDYRGCGMSVMEMSHRSKVFDDIIKEAEADLRDLMQIPDNYKVLFLQGGASQQFAAIPIENPLDGQTIPLILIGGAIKQPLVVDTYASQIDIAATLLAQLGLPHDEFTFSKNILNPGSPHFAYFTRPDYFGMITADNQLVYNLDANTVQLDEGTAKGANLEKGKAFLQKLYDDLAKR